MSAAFEKSAVQAQKVGGSEQNPAVSKIEYGKIVALCSGMGYSRSTIVKIDTIYHAIEVNQIFGAAYVKKTLSCADSTARNLIGKLCDMKVVAPVTGKGKGMYRFKYVDEN